MKSLHALPWSTVAVLAILAVLNLAGRDSYITWAILGIVSVYLGLDITVFRNLRGPKGDE